MDTNLLFPGLPFNASNMGNFLYIVTALKKKDLVLVYKDDGFLCWPSQIVRVLSNAVL